MFLLNILYSSGYKNITFECLMEISLLFPAKATELGNKYVSFLPMVD